ACSMLSRSLVAIFSSRLCRHPCAPLFPYTTLFRYVGDGGGGGALELVRGLAQPPLEPCPLRLEEKRAGVPVGERLLHVRERGSVDRKSTRLNSSHLGISYAVFCLKKKKKKQQECSK